LLSLIEEIIAVNTSYYKLLSHFFLILFPLVRYSLKLYLTLIV